MVVAHVATRGTGECPLALVPIVTRTLSPRNNTRMPTGQGISLDRMKRGTVAPSLAPSPGTAAFSAFWLGGFPTRRMWSVCSGEILRAASGLQRVVEGDWGQARLFRKSDATRMIRSARASPCLAGAAPPNRQLSKSPPFVPMIHQAPIDLAASKVNLRRHARGQGRPGPGAVDSAGQSVAAAATVSTCHAPGGGKEPHRDGRYVFLRSLRVSCIVN